MEKKLIVITGGSGFLMRNFIEDYGDRYDIVAPRSTEVNWVTGQGVNTLPKRPDILIHSAAIYGGLVFNQKYPEKILLDNTRISANVFEYVIDAQPKKFISVGSACAYPGNATGVLSESMIGSGRMEKTVELYALNKLWMLAASERLLTDWTHLVLANMYGPYDHTELDKSHVTSALIHKFLAAKKNNTDVHLLGTGESYRSLTFVKDVCDVINYFVLNNGINSAINVGHDRGITIKEMAQTIADIVGFNNNIVWGSSNDNGALMKVLDYTKLNQIYPSRNQTSLRDGLIATIKYIAEK
jgi:GDP-L-fucose synthase